MGVRVLGRRMRVGDLVTFNKSTWGGSLEPYLCKTVELSMDRMNGDPNDFRSEYLNIDDIMMIVCVHRVNVGAKYALLSHTGRIGWAWDVWVQKC